MAEGITRIAVEGFKSIAKRQEIEIRPLTILAGANSSGKSSIMQPLLMLKQTLEATTDPGPLWIGGPNVKFTTTEQFFSRSAKSTQLSVEIATAHFSFRVVFGRGVKYAAEVLEETQTRGNNTLVLRPGMTSDELLHAIEQSFPIDDYQGSASVVLNRFFLDVKLAGLISSNPIQFMERAGRFIQDVVHVPGLRGNPERTYPVRSAGPSFPGTFEDYTASVISAWQADDPAKHSALNADLEHLGLAEQISARTLNNIQIELQVNRVAGAEYRDMVSIRDVGFGVSQTLPILVSLRVAADGQVVYLEEPEIHLHPRAQTRLADILADAAKRGVRVVAETHSSLLLRAIQTLVARGVIEPDLVQLHWFSRDSAGVTQISSATPDENGAFGEWPEDFGDVALQSERDYLDAVETKLAR